MGETREAARPLRIGQLARLCGVSPDTLRHYERLRLLRPDRRMPGGYRVYGSGAAARVRLVQVALSVGFTLAELSRLLVLRDAGRPPCRAVRALAAAKLEELDRNWSDMVRLREGLRRLLENWDIRLEATPAGSRAGLLDVLVSGELDLDLPRRSPAVPRSREKKGDMKVETREHPRAAASRNRGRRAEQRAASRAGTNIRAVERGGEDGERRPNR
jgi:DNA-binding transcriptional MerR regulator